MPGSPARHASCRTRNTIQTGGETKMAKQSAKADAAEAKAANDRICPTAWIARANRQRCKTLRGGDKQAEAKTH